MHKWSDDTFIPANQEEAELYRGTLQQEFEKMFPGKTVSVEMIPDTKPKPTGSNGSQVLLLTLVGIVVLVVGLFVRHLFI